MLLNHKDGRVERSSATLDNGPVEELIGISGLTLQGDLQIFILEKNPFITGSHTTRKTKADVVKFVQAELYELLFRLLVTSVNKVVSDVLHRVVPTFIIITSKNKDIDAKLL